MKKGGLVAWLAVSLAVVVGLGAWMVGFGARPRLGLDLVGGISVTMTPVVEEGEQVDSAILDETVEIIRSRVNSLGIAETEIARQGNDIVVQLPGIDDEQRALDIIGRTAKLTFRPVVEVITPDSEAYEEEGPDCETNPHPDQPLADDDEAVLCGVVEVGPDGEEVGPALKYRVGPAPLNGTNIDDGLARPQVNSQGQPTNIWEVALDLDGPGSAAFEAITDKLACERDESAPGGGRLAIVLDDVVESAPTMDTQVACGTGIQGGEATISVGGDREDAQDLALVLRAGSLPLTLEPSTVLSVSPTLGAASLRAGILAGLIGLALVAIYLIAFYRVLGVMGVLALFVFGITIIGLLTAMGGAGYTLTLAGIAGVIVSVGIAADSSILYLERIRDEAATGKTVRTSVVRAFKPAFRTNITANFVTIVAALILYFLAVGSVRGFALTLGMATALDLVILYAFTRPAIILLGQSNRLTPRGIRAHRQAPATAAGGSK